MTRSIVVAITTCAVVAGVVHAQEAPAGFTLRDVPATAARTTGDTPAVNFDDAGMAGGEAVSPGKAILYSLLLPGLGDHYLGNKERAVTFFATEAAIWTAFAVFRVQGAQREDSYEEFAVRFAGVSRTGHSDDFYATLREYDSSAAYEDAIKQEGQTVLYPYGSHDALEDYFVANRLADYEDWQWSSFDRRIEYSELRSASKSAYRRSTYMIAAAAANRIVSAVFAYTSVRARTAADARARRYRLDIDVPMPGESPYDASVSLVRNF